MTRIQRTALRAIADEAKAFASRVWRISVAADRAHLQASCAARAFIGNPTPEAESKLRQAWAAQDSATRAAQAFQAATS